MYSRLSKILYGFKDQVRARPSGEECGLEDVFDYLGVEYSAENIPDLPFRKMANLQTWFWKTRCNFSRRWQRIDLDDVVSPLKGGVTRRSSSLRI